MMLCYLRALTLTDQPIAIPYHVHTRPLMLLNDFHRSPGTVAANARVSCSHLNLLTSIFRY